MANSTRSLRADTPRRPPPGGLIEIHRHGQYCNVIPAVRQLDRYLYTIRHELVDDGSGRERLMPVPYPLIWAKKDSRGTRYCQCFAGLEPLVEELLGRLGLLTRLTGKRSRVLPPPEQAGLARFEDVDRAVLDLVRRHDRGLIRYDPTDVEVARLIAQIAQAWKKARIVVATTRVADARELRRRLLEYYPKASLFTHRRNGYHASRITVATYGSLGAGPIAIERRTILIATDPADLFSSPGIAAVEGLRDAARARVYGLLPEDVQLAPHLRSLVTALFGMAEAHVPKHGHSRRPVDVAFTRIVGGGRVPDQRDDLSLKRSALWKHPLRNRRVARLFADLVLGEIDRLVEQFPDLAELDRGRLRGRAVLLVENVEHGLELARLLPGVPLVADADSAWQEDLSPERRTFLKAVRPKGRPTKDSIIVTGAALAKAGRFDVLVRADGGTGLPPIPREHLVAPYGRDARLLLIDFDDRHHPAPRRWSRARREAYVGQGWAVAGQRQLSPLELFLAARPGVTP